MDHFGIGAAMKGMALNYMNAARASGRTTSLVESVKDGDRIVFADARECKRVEKLCMERGVEVKCIVVPATAPQRLLEQGTSQGRTIFDHGWVERYFLQAIEQCQSDIDNLERQTSGYGEAHRATRRRAEEIAKWPIVPNFEHPKT